jgi:hypothetical protein
MVDRIELIQTPIERAMSGLFKECINKKSIFLKFSDRKEGVTLKRVEIKRCFEEHFQKSLK